MDALGAIDDKLADDNAVGSIRRGNTKIIEFPGRNRHKESSLGPILQPSTLHGEVIQVGGRDETINVHIKSGDSYLRCIATKDLARRLAQYIFGRPVRLHGRGTWSRAESGGWKLHRFDIESFEVLDETPLSTLFDGLRARLASPEAGRLNPVDDAAIHFEGKVVAHAGERVLGLLRELEQAREQILIPAPVLCEVLVTEGVDHRDVLTTLRNSAFIRIGDFDERSAIELATRLRAAITAGDPKEGVCTTKAAMKFDRQIVAISLVNGARVLYSDDDGVNKFAAGCGLPVQRVADLRVPASQPSLPFEPEETISNQPPVARA